MARHRPIQHGTADGAGLGHQGDVTAHQLGGDAGGGVEAVLGPEHAQGVGAENADAMATRRLHDLVLQVGASLVGLGEARRINNGHVHALGAALAQDAGYCWRGGGDQRQIERLIDLLQAGIAALAGDLFVFGVDGEAGSLESALDQVAEDQASHGFRIVAGAEYGNAGGNEQRIHV